VRKRLTVLTDGAAWSDRSRGVPTHTAFGIVILDEAGETVAEYGEQGGPMRNDHAELEAALRGAAYASLHGATEVTLVSDCTAVTNAETLSRREHNSRREALLTQLRQFERYILMKGQRSDVTRAHDLANGSLPWAMTCDLCRNRFLIPRDAETFRRVCDSCLGSS
jgi:ribonuclease HI